jgi:hypothetical protein
MYMCYNKVFSIYDKKMYIEMKTDTTNNGMEIYSYMPNLMFYIYLNLI